MPGKSLVEQNKELDAFFKCRKVIMSCKTKEQLETARRYSQLFDEKIAKTHRSIIEYGSHQHQMGLLNGIMYCKDLQFAGFELN